MLKVYNMLSDRGNPVANQFVIHDGHNSKVYFQSYSSLIAEYDYLDGRLTLGRRFDYSVTTVKYLHKWIDRYVGTNTLLCIEAAPGKSYAAKLKWCIDNDMISYEELMV